MQAQISISGGRVRAWQPFCRKAWKALTSSLTDLQPPVELNALPALLLTRGKRYSERCCSHRTASHGIARHRLASHGA